MENKSSENIKNKKQSPIILYYNNKTFKLDDYLKEYDQIDWSCSSAPCKDTTIYFYCSDKQQVMYEGVVIKAPVPREEMFDESGYSIITIDKPKVMRIQITKRAKATDEDLSKQKLPGTWSSGKGNREKVILDNYPELKSYLMKAFDKYPLCESNNRVPSILSKKDMYIQQLESCKNLILNGAPGTGKTFLAKQIAAEMILGCEYDENNDIHKAKMNEKFGFVQFHPSFDYTDFVEGLRPVQDDKGNVGFKREDGIFMAFCRKALKAYNAAEKKDDAPKYIFVIDEINRGEISKIFGELFFSIDPGYRGSKGEVTTQYANLWTDNFDKSRRFYVPENVYIIGTMNDIDRSVESMDFAIRRRFAWKEITVESRQSMLDEDNAWNNKKPEQKVIDELKTRMNNLNACIIDKYGKEEISSKDKIGLTSAYQIGASYFLKYGLYGDFEKLWENHLKGLLYEYLRGTTNIKSKIERLYKAYNDNTAH